jgi:hypothetical protein
VEDHSLSELSAPRADDLVDPRVTERHEDQVRLVDVAIVAVDDVGLDLVRAEAAAEQVGGHRPGRPAAEDHDSLLGHRSASLSPASVLRGAARCHPRIRGTERGQLRRRRLPWSGCSRGDGSPRSRSSRPR